MQSVIGVVSAPCDSDISSYPPSVIVVRVFRCQVAVFGLVSFPSRSLSKTPTCIIHELLKNTLSDIAIGGGRSVLLRLSPKEDDGVLTYYFVMLALVFLAIFPLVDLIMIICNMPQIDDFDVRISYMHSIQLY